MDVPSRDCNIELLERRVTHLQLVVVLLILSGIAVMLMGSTLPQAFGELRAQRFILQNDLGQPRGLWAVSNGEAFLTLYDSKLQPRLRVAVSEKDRPEVLLLDAGEQVSLAITADGAASRILMFDRARKARVVVEHEGDAPRMSLLDGSETERIRLTAATDESKILVFDKTGRERFQLFTLDDAAGLGVKDDAGRQRIVISEIPGTGPVLLMRDGDRQTIFKAP
jgi:hypothetical protein